MISKVSVSVGGTYNIGNFESVRVEVSEEVYVSTALPVEEKRDKYRKLRKELSGILVELANAEIRDRRA